MKIANQKFENPEFLERLYVYAAAYMREFTVSQQPSDSFKEGGEQITPCLDPYFVMDTTKKLSLLEKAKETTNCIFSILQVICISMI